MEVRYKSADCPRETCGLFVCLARLVIHNARLGSRSSAPGKSLDRKFVSQCDYLDSKLRTLQIGRRSTWLRLGFLAVCCALLDSTLLVKQTYLGTLRAKNQDVQLFQKQMNSLPVADDIIIMVSNTRAMGRQQPRRS